MMALAVVVVVLGALFVLRPQLSADAFVPADGKPHRVDLPAEEQRGLFMREYEGVACTLVDGVGAQIHMRPVAGSHQVNDWIADTRFDTSDGDLTVTCTPLGPDADVEREARIGPLPDLIDTVVSLALSVGIAILLGIGGLALLTATVIRRSL